MNLQEHLLTIASEECSEVAHRISKAKRFGLTEIQAGQDLTNAERIVYEYSQLHAMIMMMYDMDMLPQIINMAHVDEKLVKVEKWLEYSRLQGTLTD